MITPLSGTIITDVVSKGTLKVSWSYVYFDHDLIEDSKYKGLFVIDGNNSNPLFDIASTEPLRLQGLIGKFQYGDKTFLMQIESIKEFKRNETEYNKEIILDTVEFKILDNLQYLESLEEYRNENLL